MLWRFFGLVGLMVRRRTGSTWAPRPSWAAAVAVPPLGLVVPAVLARPPSSALSLTAPIGIVGLSLVLVFIYYVVFTPAGLLIRALGHDPLTRRFEPDRTSYWVRRPEAAAADRYFRQF